MSKPLLTAALLIAALLTGGAFWSVLMHPDGSPANIELNSSGVPGADRTHLRFLPDGGVRTEPEQ